MKIAITVPAYNEEETLGKILEEINATMANAGYDYFIHVADDGSQDQTSKIAKGHGAIVTRHAINYGLAETFRTEIKRCLELGADIIVHIDADGQYLAQDIPHLIAEITSGNDLVLGSRFLGKIESMPVMKRIGNVAFSSAISQITRIKITDAQTGFRAFTKEVAKMGIISNHTYTQEQIIRAAKNKFKVKEIPVDTRKTRQSRLMKSHPLLQPFEYAIKAWINLFRIYRDFEPLKFFGFFGAGFFGAGLFVGLWLTSKFILTGKVGHMPATILTMLLITTAVQIWLFGFLADMNRKQ